MDNRLKILGPMRPLLIAALMLSIPAFYLSLSGTDTFLRDLGRFLYAMVSLMMLVELALRLRGGRQLAFWRRSALEMLILFGTLLSCLPNNSPWSSAEWIARLILCALVFARIVLVLEHWVPPNRLLRIMIFAAGLWAIAGAGFYWLEPRVVSYADGLWLAFITGATVGYGDLVPSTDASRIFAVFIVLLGYAVFSFITAGISALFVGEDEQQLTRELHADILVLHQEIKALRQEIGAAKSATKTDVESARAKLDTNK